MSINKEYLSLKNEILIHTSNIAASKNKIKELKQDQRKLLYAIFNGDFEQKVTQDQVDQLKLLNKKLKTLDKAKSDYIRTTNIAKKIGRLYDNWKNGRLSSKKLIHFLKDQLAKPEFQPKKEEPLPEKSKSKSDSHKKSHSTTKESSSKDSSGTTTSKSSVKESSSQTHEKSKSTTDESSSKDSSRKSKMDSISKEESYESSIQDSSPLEGVLTTTINDLPVETLKHIFDKLTYIKWDQEAAHLFPNIQLVSKAFAVAAQQSKFTHLKTDEILLIDVIGKLNVPDVLRFIKKHAADLSTLNLMGCGDLTDDDIKQIAEYCPHVERLIFGECLAKTFEAVSLFKELKFLQFYDSEKFKYFNISSDCIEELSIEQCRTLVDIKLDQLSALRVLTLGHNLSFPNSFPASLQKLTIKKSIPIDGLLRLNTNQISELSLEFEQLIYVLRLLELPTIKKLTIKIEGESSELGFLNKMPNIEELDFSVPNLINMPTLKCMPFLRKLTIRQSGIRINRRRDEIKNLEELVIDNNELFVLFPRFRRHEPKIYLDKLRNIKIENCNNFKEIELESLPNLSRLEIADCPSFNSSENITLLPNNCIIKLSKTGLADFDGTVQDWKEKQLQP